jgi:hypothetical protein
MLIVLSNRSLVNLISPTWYFEQTMPKSIQLDGITIHLTCKLGECWSNLNSTSVFNCIFADISELLNLCLKS